MRAVVPSGTHQQPEPARAERIFDLCHVGSAPLDDHETWIQNVDTVDRVIRILAGAALIAASLLGSICACGWSRILPKIANTRP